MTEQNAAEDANRYKVGRRFFIYAPPLKGVRPSKRKPPNSPYKDAPAWKCSVYYYWWEYLRRHEGYRQCCEQGGKGEYAKLYSDFGNVHSHDDFWQWWSKEAHSELFCEPTARQIRVLDENRGFEPTLSNDTLTLELPLEVRSAYLIARIRTVLKQYEARAKAAKASLSASGTMGANGQFSDGDAIVSISPNPYSYAEVSGNLHGNATSVSGAFFTTDVSNPVVNGSFIGSR
jgi:hypothetical protein